MRSLLAVFAVLITANLCLAQWGIQNSHTTADLRGIDSIGGGIAWASGTNGAVLRTVDGGASWQNCSIPPGAGPLDFRGVRALDGNIAIVMSSGPGDLSRTYKTTDGCRTWTLLFTNPDKDGFCDAILYDANTNKIFVLGDPVNGEFVLYTSGKDGRHWAKIRGDHGLKALPGEAAFAASNSILVNAGGQFSFVTGGARPEIIRAEHEFSQWSRTSLPFTPGESSGAFSIALSPSGKEVVAAGGDYKQPNLRERSAAYSSDGGYSFMPAQTPPGGYRSAVAYDSRAGIWITAGPNGTDISRDGGRHWTPLHPAAGETPDADKNWNALSLPFAAGPHGRIGKLRPGALEPSRDPSQNPVTHIQFP